MALTSAEIILVQNSWQRVMENAEESAVLIFKTFLDKYDYYSKFERFRNHPRESIAENKVFRGHALKLIKNLDEAITNLNNPGALNAVLNALGTSHARRKIQKIHFEHLGEVILDVLEKHFNTTKEEQNAYNKVLCIALFVVGQSLAD